MLEQHGSSLGQEELYLEHDTVWKNLAQNCKTNERKAEAMQRCKDKFLAYAFIFKADQEKYGKLKDDLQNDYTKGANNYPKTLVEAFQMLNNYKQSYKKPVSKNTGVSFAQKGKGGKNNNKKGNNNQNNNNKFMNVECYNCHKKGHIATNCPEKANTTNVQVNTANAENNNTTGSPETVVANTKMQLLNIASVNNGSTHCGLVNEQYTFIQSISNFNGKNSLKNWILLDNQSTTDIFCNGNILKDLKDTNEKMIIYTNGGSLTTNKKGILPGYGPVWYHPDAITNILSLNNMKKKWKVTYDSENEDRFTVHKPEKLVHFKCSDNGLYFHDITNQSITLINTIAENLEGFLKCQIEQARWARKLYMTMGLPSMHDFKELIRNNMLLNCPVTIEDVKNCEQIFGAPVASLKGKTTRQKPDIVTTDYFEVPKDILHRHKNVILSADIFYVQRIPFLLLFQDI